MGRWKCVVIALAVLAALGAGCQETGGESPDRGTERMEEVVSQPGRGPGDPPGDDQTATPDALPDDGPDLDGEINSALLAIPGAEGLVNWENGLYLLKEYGTDMGWSEANQLENLERGTPYDQVGKYDTYFLLIPKYVGSRVEVSRVDFQEDAGLVPVETLYWHADTPDSYGLVLTSSEPEGIPVLAVTVEFAGRSHCYSFSYDGRGDRPAIQIFGGEAGESHTPQ